jgi:predicted ATPase
MLRAIHLKDFKSFANEQVKFAPLTVLVGANASGKSNLLDAIRLIQGLAQGFSLAEVLQGRSEGGREIWKGLRGGAAEAIRNNQSRAVITSDWERSGQIVTHHLAFMTRPHPRIIGEAASGPPPGVQLDSWSGASIIDFSIEALPDTEPGGQESLIFALGLSEDESQLPTPEELRSIRLLRQVLKQVVVLELSPDRMRAYAPKHARELGSDGENLSSVIWSRSRTQDEKLEWVDWLSELCAPEIADIDFIETELGDVMLVLIEKDGARTSARALSDGTLRFLGTLVAMRTAPSGSIFLMEELEIGLHPQRIHLLIEFLENVTKERGIQVIATTHSPQILQALSSEGRNNAVLCARTPSRSGTVLRRFADIPHFKDVIARSGIDHLFTTGWLERAL